MDIDSMNEEDIEEEEYTYLQKISETIYNKKEDFFLKVDESYKYLDYILPPLVSASKRGRSFNPFDEIFEIYLSDILVERFEKEGFEHRPLGYSSDVTLESEDVLLMIDLKSANLNNPSDYRNTINVGENQFSYEGYLPLKIKVSGDTKDVSSPPSAVYPNIPEIYEVEDGKKLTLTYGVIVIYNPYRDAIDNLRERYNEVQDLLEDNFRDYFEEKLTSKFDIPIADKFNDLLDESPRGTTKTKGDKISQSLYIAYILRKDLDFLDQFFDLDEEEKSMLRELKESIQNVKEKIAGEALPAIIVISIPNGLLSPDYDEELVSGKSFAQSVRYHYGEGKFKNFKEEPRVIFSHLIENESTREKLLDIFNCVYAYNEDLELKEVRKENNQSVLTEL